MRRVSHLLHDIRNKSTNTVKSGKYANVKNAKKNLPLTLQQRKDLIDKSIMADDNDESDEEEENEDLHDLEMSKIFEKVINGTIDDTECETDGSDLEDVDDLMLQKSLENLSKYSYDIDCDFEPVPIAEEERNTDKHQTSPATVTLQKQNILNNKNFGTSKIQQENNCHRLEFVESDDEIPESSSTAALEIEIDTTAAERNEDKASSALAEKSSNIKKEILLSPLHNHPLLNKFSNPPTEQWCRNACEKLGIQFERFLHSPKKGYNLALSVPDDTVKTRADGNCGYETVAVLASGSGIHHEQIRHAIADYVTSMDIPNIGKQHNLSFFLK